MENEIQEPQPAYGYKKNITPEEYLEIDANSERKVEYVGGETFVIDGQSLRHNRIVSHIIGEIGNQLDETNYNIFPSQMRVASPNFHLFAYPDASIVCGKIKLYENIFDTLVNPTVIFEVVSQSSIANDYRSKFYDYKQIASLEEYVLIDSFEKICIDIFRRQSNNQWLNETYVSLEESLVLQSVDVTISLKDIYENINF